MRPITCELCSRVCPGCFDEHSSRFACHNTSCDLHRGPVVVTEEGWFCPMRSSQGRGGHLAHSSGSGRRVPTIIDESHAQSALAQANASYASGNSSSARGPAVLDAHSYFRQYGGGSHGGSSRSYTPSSTSSSLPSGRWHRDGDYFSYSGGDSDADYNTNPDSEPDSDVEAPSLGRVRRRTSDSDPVIDSDYIESESESESESELDSGSESDDDLDAAGRCQTCQH
ncbi:hypothetical protein QBC46DRAFT_404848 [Diplogelasinospora grovesii]|uniref:Uncharacterized protein n=1 Tax=Diplogelasinospora grovesii TaxID=303347 RepID=A0AAN6S829_9PEZI|nr:hypothetical protein QBC46DRAFT_404848 [Diplogelasinospora grovesii]